MQRSSTAGLVMSITLLVTLGTTALFLVDTYNNDNTSTNGSSSRHQKHNGYGSHNHDEQYRTETPPSKVITFWKDIFFNIMSTTPSNRHHHHSPHNHHHHDAVHDNKMNKHDSFKVIQEEEVEEVEAKYKWLTTTLCTDKACSQNCTTYVTPLHNKCYNGKNLSPLNSTDDDDANPFGEHDINDKLILEKRKNAKHYEPAGIKRLFFKSTDEECGGGITDSYNFLPLNECIGPFGAPRPWGKFEVTPSLQENEESADVQI